ncbi:MAG: hypothetical protein LBD80_06845 [Tannerella sp.]|nr:hypothetical protein [Tannerella sp.]
MKKDWLAKSHESLYEQGSQTTNYLTSTVLACIGITGLILTWYNNEFITRWTRFSTAFQNWQNQTERTIAKTTILMDAETDFRKVYRQLYKSNPLVTNDDLVSAGFPKRHTGGG